jgi:hypothetical protein
VLKPGLRKTPASVPVRGRFGVLSRITDPRISLELLTTSLPASRTETALFELITRELYLSNGVTRTTYPGRFANFDPIVNELLRQRHDVSESLVAHDWAASACLTSAEWFESLTDIFPNASVIASDLTMNLVSASMPDGDTFIFEPNGAPLQFLRGPFVVRLSPPESPLWAVNWLIARQVMPRARAIAAQIDFEELSEDGEQRIGKMRVKAIPLVHPRARTDAAAHENFGIFRHSAFEALSRPVDVIRTMNIYNLDYFSRDQLTTGVRAVWASLKERGCWIVGRTHTNGALRHAATIYERSSNGFRVLTKTEGGSEIEGLVGAVNY